jgi:hypothetical protein
VNVRFAGAARIAAIGDILPYVAPGLAVWTLYLLAYWPGIMSLDSLDQWGQAMSGRYRDWHPAAHTFVIRALTLIWASPAVVGVVQIAALGALLAWALQGLRALGATRGVRVAVAAVFALHPIHGLYAVTLWKDVPYSLALLAMTVALVHIVESGGEWLRRPANAAALASFAAIAWLMRHNGGAPVVVTLVALPLLFRRAARPAFAVAAVTLVVVGLVRGPLYRAAGVERPGISGMVLLFPLGAVMARHPDALPPEDRAFLGRIIPADQWRAKYTPFDISPLVFGHSYSADFEAARQGRARLCTIFLRAVAAQPAAMAGHLMRSSSLVWSIPQFPGGHTFMSTRRLEPNALGLRPRSFLPGVRLRLDRLASRAGRPDLNWLVFRPALWLFAGIGAAALLAARRGSVRFFLPALPVLANAGVVALVCVGQDVRFLYSAFLAAPFLAGYAATAWRRGPCPPPR